MNEIFAIDRKNGVSAWKQIADQINRAILSGEYDETGMVPPETVLAERFGVNRHTVRSAIASLAEDGVLRRVQGRGTIIEKRERLIYPVGKRTRFSDGLGSQATDLEMRLVSSGALLAPKPVATALALSMAAQVVMIETISFADAKPVSVSSHYFDATRFPQMPRLFEELHSITRAFAAQGVDDYVRVYTEVSGRLGTAQECSRLALSAGSVVLDTTSLNADSSGMPVQYSHTIFAAERISLKLDTHGS